MDEVPLEQAVKNDVAFANAERLLGLRATR